MERQQAAGNGETGIRIGQRAAAHAVRSVARARLSRRRFGPGSRFSFPWPVSRRLLTSVFPFPVSRNPEPESNVNRLRETGKQESESGNAPPPTPCAPSPVHACPAGGSDPVPVSVSGGLFPVAC